jgi:hypothetical protein
MRSAVAGIGTSVTPSGASASRIAFITVGVLATVLPSPTPLAPSGLVVLGTGLKRTEARMKSLQDIQDEFLDQQGQEPLAKVREARAELNALLQRAGIKDGPDDMFGDDADRWRDEDYYRRRVRELVFKVPDRELRRQIMAKLSSYRYELWDRWKMRRLFDERFADRLRAQRCNPPRPLEAPLLAGPLALVGVAYWFGGALDALVIGLAVALPALVLFVVNHISNLHRHDVIVQEAIKFVERNAALSLREAHRRQHLPEIFSRREERTGEPDEEIEALSA